MSNLSDRIQPTEPPRHHHSARPNHPTGWEPARSMSAPLTPSRRWRCRDCTKITDHLLSAPDPFTVGEELHACPHCRSVMGTGFAAICDEPGCTETVTSGWGDPRRWTCSCHTAPLSTPTERTDHD